MTQKSFCKSSNKSQIFNESLRENDFETMRVNDAPNMRHSFRRSFYEIRNKSKNFMNRYSTT